MSDDAWALASSFAILSGVIATLFGALVGYVLNLVAIAHWAEGPGMLALRCIGAFIAPLGAILGWVG